MKNLFKIIAVFIWMAIFSQGLLTGQVRSPEAMVVVYSANLQGWQFTNSGTGQAVTLENGPATPPLGTGSVELSVGPDGNGAAQIRHPSYGGVQLSSISALSYSTYVSQDGSGGQAPYILLNIDTDNNGTQDDLIFFEPVYQSAVFFPSNPQGPLTTNTWQTWNALAGGWYSLNGVGGATPGTGVKSLSTYIAAVPNARILNTGTGLGGFRIVAGFGAGAWDNFVGNVDNLTITAGALDTTYDFEFMAPSAAAVNVGGRVLTAMGRPISGAVVSMTDSAGATRTALSSPLGYYNFNNVNAGASYAISARAKGYNFTLRLITINDELTDLDLTAEP